MRKRLLPFLAGVFLLALAPALAFATPDGSSDDRRPPFDGGISGIATYGSCHIADDLANPCLPLIAATILAQHVDTNAMYQTYTDEAGKYEFTNLLPGVYVVTATPQFWPGPQCPVLRVEVFPGAVTRANFQCGTPAPALGAIEGQVTEAFCSGYICQAPRPLPGLDVTAYNQAGQAVAWATTDRNGNYKLPDLRPGGYTVEASSPLQPGLTCPGTSVLVRAHSTTRANIQCLPGEVIPPPHPTPVPASE